MKKIKSEQIEKKLEHFFPEKKAYQEVILFFIILLGLFVRVYKINGLDVGGAWDEGYSMIAASNLIEDKKLLFINHMPDKDGILIDKPPGLYVFGAAFIKPFGNHEISARAVSILFGVLSIYAFFLLVNYITKETGLAILSACIFAFFPLHVALSRAFIGHVPALFFSITSIYLLIKGVGEKKLKLLFIAGLLVSINLFILLWFGILPVIGVMIWMFLYIYRDKDLRKYYFYSLLCVFVGLLIFMTWPLLLSLNEDKYYGFHGDCVLPNCDVWDMLFKHNMVNRTGMNKLDIMHTLSTPYSTYVDIIQRLSRPYLGQGHFSFSREFDSYYKIFLYFGIFLSLMRLNLRCMRKISLFWLFWLMPYLPIQFGENLYTQYLMLVVPFFCFYTAYGIYGLDAIQLKLFQNKLLLTGITILICCLFFLKAIAMIKYDREYLYKTNYKLMGEYLRNKTAPSKVICSRYPGMSYYLKGECKPWDAVNEDLGKYIKENEIKYVDIRRAELKQFEPILQRVGCKKINKLIGVSDDAEHSLFRCGEHLNQ